MNTSPPRRVILTWLGLLALIGVSAGVSFLPLGIGNPTVLIGIAAAQGALIVAFIIKLPKSPPLNWVFAGAGLFWLLILFAFSAADYATRPNPGTASVPRLINQLSPATGAPLGFGTRAAPQGHRD